MKAKGPAAAKAEEGKKKGLALFGPKPPTPKLLRAFGGNINRNLLEKLKVTALTFLSTCGHVGAKLTAKHVVFLYFFPRLLVASEDFFIFYYSFLGVNVQCYFQPLTALLY